MLFFYYDRNNIMNSHIFYIRYVFLASCLLMFTGFICSNTAQASARGSEITKPGWFWNQPGNCGMTAIGLSRHSTMYPENARKVAHEKAVNAYLRQVESHHTGGEAFSVTERGAVWLGDDIREVYDTTRFEDLMENLAVLDYQVSGNLAMVLVGSDNCSDETERRMRQYPLVHRPAWVDNLPSSTGYIYAVGLSESYYYSVSSWDQAEIMARRNLSASIQSQVQGLLEHQTGISHEIIYSNMAVTLRNAVVQSRYYDPVTRLYYVLARMPV